MPSPACPTRPYLADFAAPVLNVAGPEAVSIRRFALRIGQILGIEPKFEIAQTPRSFNLIADISRLRALVDAAFLPFDDAMRETYAG